MDGAPLDPPGGSGRRYALGLWALALPFLLLRLGAKDVWEASEGRPLESAREMRAAGVTLVQRTNGEVDLTKPPLYAWAARAMFAVGGDTEAAGRVPAVVAALGALAAVAALGRRVGGPRAGFLAGAVLLTTAKFAWQARLAELELPLAAGVLGAFAALTALLDTDGDRSRDRRARARLATAGGLGWAFAGAVKGPVALLLVGAGLTGYAVAVGAPRRLLSGPVLRAALLGVAGVAAWPLAVGLHDRAWLDTLLSFARGDNVGHRRELTYYLVQAPAFALPWTPAVLAGALGLAGRGRPEPARRRVRGFTGALVAGFVAMSLLEAKQTHYLVPLVFPLGALLGGLALDGLLRAPGADAGFAPRLRRGLLVAGAGLAVAAAAVPTPPVADEAGFLRAAAVTLGVALALAAAAAFAGTRAAPAGSRAAGRLAALLTAVVVTEAAVLGWVVPARNPLESSRPFLAAVDRTVPPGEPLAWTVFGSHSDYLWHLDAARVGSTGIPELLADGDEATAAEVARWLGLGGRRWAIVTGAQADRLSGAFDVVHRDDAFQKKKRRVALVRTREAP